MPRVDTLAEVSARNPEVVLIERLPSEMPADEHNADQSAERTGGAPEDAQPHEQTNGGRGAAAPARSVRRATARRASNRRATARKRHDDSETRIIDFLAHHPGGTAGDIAKGLNLNPANVSTHLTQLAKAGEINKATHGYNTKQPARPRGPQHPPHHAH